MNIISQNSAKIKVLCKLTLILAVIFFLLSDISFGTNFFEVKQGEQKYQTVITTKEQAAPIFEKMRGYLYYKMNMNVVYPYVMDIVSAEELDKICPKAYRGVEIGLYRFEGTFHHIYILNNLAVDDFLGTAAHEFTHAWQTENCPADQNLITKEGFADWVAYKVLQFDGAINSSQGIFYRSDPVYGQGFKTMIQIDDKSGIQAVINYVKTAK